MVDIGIASCRVVVSRADATQRKGAYVIGSTHIKLLTEGHGIAIAIGIDGTAYDACGKCMVWTNVVVAASFDVALDKLCVGRVEQGLATHAEGFAHGGIEHKNVFHVILLFPLSISITVCLLLPIRFASVSCESFNFFLSTGRFSVILSISSSLDSVCKILPPRLFV